MQPPNLWPTSFSQKSPTQNSEWASYFFGYLAQDFCWDVVWAGCFGHVHSFFVYLVRSGVKSPSSKSGRPTWASKYRHGLNCCKERRRQGHNNQIKLILENGSMDGSFSHPMPESTFLEPLCSQPRLQPIKLVYAPAVEHMRRNGCSRFLQNNHLP